VETGRFFKPIEKSVYGAIDMVYGYRAVFKGMNAEQQGEAARESWDAIQDPVAFPMDFSRFDQHVSVEALEFEHSIYKLWYRNNRHFNRLMKLQLNNKGFAYCGDGKLKYKVKGKRMSGDSNTAVGNVVLVTALFHSVLSKIKSRLICNGDDSVIIVNRKDAHLIEGLHDHCLRYGFNLKIEDPVYDFSKITFCQCQPVFDGTKWLMVRDPRVAISKDLVAIKPLDNPKIRDMWLSAVGQGGLALTAGLPVWQSFYSMMYRSSNNARPLSDPTMEGGFWNLSKGMDRTQCEIGAEQRYWFWKAFGILPEAQLVLESYYDKYQLGAGEPRKRFTILPL